MSSRRILVLNPNTDPRITRMMVAIAAEDTPAGTRIEGATVAAGAPLILDPVALDQARKAVEAMAPEIAMRACDGVVVAAFGDPGMEALRHTLSCPVVGLAEASMAAAAALGRRFCVVTTTPDLAPAIDRLARDYGHGNLFAGTFCTAGDPHTLMADAEELTTALHATCEAAIGAAGVEAIIIGGGGRLPWRPARSGTSCRSAWSNPSARPWSTSRAGLVWLLKVVLPEVGFRAFVGCRRALLQSPLTAVRSRFLLPLRRCRRRTGVRSDGPLP